VSTTISTLRRIKTDLQNEQLDDESEWTALHFNVEFALKQLHMLIGHLRVDVLA